MCSGVRIEPMSFSPSRDGNVFGLIVKLPIMGDCCSIRAVALVRIIFAQRGKLCGRVYGTINDANSLTLVAEAIRCVVSLNLALLSVIDQFLPRCDN